MATFERADTVTKVVDLIATELKIDKATITESASLQELGADSLDMVEIIMKLEELFGIEITDEDAERLTHVREIIDYVSRVRTK